MHPAPDHERWADAVGAYLLGALDEDEQSGFTAHLGSCQVCRHEVEHLQVAVDALPMAVPQYDAPKALGDRLMATVRSEAELLRAAGPAADRPRAEAREPRRSWADRLRLGSWALSPQLAVTLVALLLVAGAGFGVLASDGDDPVGPSSRTVAGTVDAPGGRVDLVVRGNDDHSTLVASKLPKPPAGRVYQVWLKRPGKDPEPTDALFSVRRDGSASVDVPGSLDGVEAVLVTDEPMGGSEVPTGKLIIQAATA